MKKYDNKKVIVSINESNYGCTGNIADYIMSLARKNGYICKSFSPDARSQKKNIKEHAFIGHRVLRRLSQKLNWFTGLHDSFNCISTMLFLKRLNELQPQIIHCHNLHPDYINVKMLFQYIKKKNIKFVWTLHDCWAFTGLCPYFTVAKCEKWKTGCYNCSNYKLYPSSFVDNSKKMYKRKKNLFTGIESAIIVTPSQWLADLVSESYLQEYPCKIIPNGLDLSVFYPRENIRFRNEHGLENKFIIMGIAGSWGVRKGLDIFEHLSNKLDERYQIVLVGISNVNSKKIICIPKTENQDELAELYSTADVLLNPTREDNFPTVNIESLACGSPILSYGEGGSAEAFDEKSGMIVSDDTIVAVLEQLLEKNFSREDCVKRGRQFDKSLKFQEYVKLYDQLLNVNRENFTYD